MSGRYQCPTGKSLGSGSNSPSIRDLEPGCHRSSTWSRWPHLRARLRQIAMIRVAPKSNMMSPTLNNPSCAWSASSCRRVCEVAACHIVLTGRTVDGIPTTGIDPALASVTKAFIPSPHSIKRTPVRTNGERSTRNTSHRMAQDSLSQTVGCCVHAN